MIFKNRQEAGLKLAERLMNYRNQDVLVLGIPRGGVIVAAEVARSLQAPLDIIIPRKISAPFNEELAVGAVAPDGTVIFDRQALALFKLQQEDLEEQIAKEIAEIERRSNFYRKKRDKLDCHRKTVILVDDGIATGMTARAALQSLQKQEPAHLVLAVPVASKEAVAELQDYTDNLVCLHLPTVFYAVGQFYQDFNQTTDEEVLAVLDSTTGSC